MLQMVPCPIFPFVLKVCSDYHKVWEGQGFHGLVYKLGFDSDVFVGNTLLRFYGECSGVNDAEKVFDKTSERYVMVVCFFFKTTSNNFWLCHAEHEQHLAFRSYLSFKRLLT